MSADDEFDQIIHLRDLARGEVLASLGIEPDAVVDGRRYQSLESLHMASTDRDDGLRVYFDGDAVAMIMIPAPEIALERVREEFGSDLAALASRQAKHAVLEVDAAAGIAVSSVDDEIGFVEIFPPTTLDDYRDRIYRDPGQFLR